jgi:GAF domain-containing protein/signal transduction histidine kinase/ActR/RegA family two-component response regulator
MVEQPHISKEEIPPSSLSRHSEETQLQPDLAAVHAISWVLSQSLDLDCVLELALEATLRVMDSQVGCIHLAAESGAGELRLCAQAGLPADFAQCNQVIPHDDLEVQRIIASGEAMVSTRWGPPFTGVSTGDEPNAEGDAPGVWVCFPIMARDQFQGLVSILIREFTPERSRLLKTIGQYVGIAVDNAGLYRRAQQDAHRLRREAERWHGLNQAAVAVGNARSEQDVYDAITRTLSSLGFSAAIIALNADDQTLWAAPRDQALTVISAATPLPRLVRALERLTGLTLIGRQFPVGQFDFYRRVIEEGQAEFVRLGAEHFAQLLPEPFTHLAPRIVHRAGLEYGIVAPLKVNGQNIGVLVVTRENLTPEDIPAVTAFAGQASAAIENARLIQAERHQREVAEMLRDLVVTVNSTLDVDQVLSIAVRRLQTLHQATACSVSFLEEGGETFVFRATTDLNIDVSQHITFPVEGSIAGQAIREHKVQVVNTVDPSSDHRAELARRTGIVGRSLLTAPLFAGDEPLGVIQIISTLPGTFTQPDAELLATTAALIETAIARAQAYAQAVQLAQAEYHQREVAETLRRVAILINASLDLDTVLDRILEQLAQVVNYDSTSLMLVENGWLTMRAIRGFEEPGQVLDIAYETANSSLFQEMLASRRPILIPDVKDDDRYTHWPGSEPVRAYIGVPLVVRDRVIGQLAVDKHQPDYYDEGDAELVFTFAQQAAIAIENARLYEAERARYREAEALRRAALALTSTISLDQVFERILAELQDVVPYDSASVQLLKGDQLEIIGGRGFPNLSELLGVSFPARGDNPNALVLDSQEPVIIEDVRPRYPAFSREPHAASNTRAWLGVPLLLGDWIIGMLALDKCQSGFYTEAHARAAVAYAAQAAIAIENARLYETEQERLAEMERRNRELAALHAVAAAVSSSLDTNVVLREALAQALETIEMESGGVYLLDEAASTLVLRICHNLPEDAAVEADQLKVGEGLSGRVIQASEPIVVEDLLTSPQLTGPAVTEAGYQTAVAVPLRAQDRILGTFFGISRQARRFSPQDLKLLVAIGDEMGMAVQNARLHQALQNYAAELEARVEARTAEVNREREQLLAVLENAGEAIVITDADGFMEYANPAWEELTGYGAAQAIQHKIRVLDDETFPDFSPPIGLLKGKENYWGEEGIYPYPTTPDADESGTVHSITRRQRIWRRELVGQRPDGTTYIVDLTVTPVFDDAMELANLVIIYRDVTQYKELDRIKSEFLSTAAHELRSPLTSLLGFSELLLLRKDLSDEERARFLKYINDHAIHLKQLVDDLLDISRIESGASFVVKLEPLELYPLFEQEIRSWQEAHPDHTYQLYAGHDWPQVHADQDRIRQVMRNLLSNATKYSPARGTITLNATPVGGYIEITVADEGIGMTDEELTHIFEKFWRANASSTAVEGTGLGLVIVKHIVEQHGGQVWVESIKGKGTVVHFTLPLLERQTTVLIAEDEGGVREIEHRILASNGIATLLARNGQQTLEIAQSRRPDLILLDLMMPGISGRDVLQALKSNPATQHIPVLVVSARSSWQTIEESYMLGAVDFLTKPFEYEELLSRVRRALKMAASGQQQAVTSHLTPAS